MRSVQLAILAASLSLGAPAQAFPELRDIKLVEGECSDKTRVGIEAAGTEGFVKTIFQCDTAIVSYHEERASLMIQFVNKRGGDSRLIGFAGTLQDREMLRVERVHLAGGARPLVPNDGHCQLFWKAGKLTDIVCGAQIDTPEGRVVPVVVFKAKSM